MALCPPKVPSSLLPTSLPFSPLLLPPFPTLPARTFGPQTQPSLSHLGPRSPLHDRPSGSSGACASPAPRLHDNPVRAGSQAIPHQLPPPAHFSSLRLRGGVLRPRDSTRRTWHHGDCRGSPRRAPPTGRRGGYASQGIADIPKRPELSSRKAGVSMVGSQGSPPFCIGDLELRAAGARLRGGVLRSHGWAGF